MRLSAPCCWLVRGLSCTLKIDRPLSLLLVLLYKTRTSTPRQAITLRTSGSRDERPPLISVW